MPSSRRSVGARSSANVELARKCLGLIRDIAERGALSWDPDDIGYALQELSQVLLERTGTEEDLARPVSALRCTRTLARHARRSRCQWQANDIH
jgi:hypothetical protein